jgi:hypothetical protein
MKATVNLDDRLYRKVKIKAAQDGVTVTSIFEAALERFLAEPTSTGKSRFELPLLKGKGGLMPGVDLTHGETLYRILEQDTPLDQQR